MIYEYSILDTTGTSVILVTLPIFLANINLGGTLILLLFYGTSIYALSGTSYFNLKD